MARDIRSIIIQVLWAAAPIALLSWPGLLPRFREHQAVYELSFYLPYFLLALAAFLGFRLNQSRIFFTSILFLLAHFALTENPLTPVVPLRAAHNAQILSVILPLCTMSFYLLGERTFFHHFTWIRTVLIIAPYLALAFLLVDAPEVYRHLISKAFLPYGNIWRLPELSILTWMSFGVFSFFYHDHSVRSFNLATWIGFVPILYGLNLNMFASSQTAVNINSAIAFSGVGLIQLTGIFSLYWRKVYIDELTRIPNRRALDEALRRLAKHYCVAMVDIDHFKKFNDTYGHDEGDHVLRFVARHLEQECRGQAYRYGGEEFCIIYDDQDLKSAERRVDHVRKTLAARQFHIRAPEDVRNRTSKKDRGRKKSQENTLVVKVTISAGVASRTDETPNARSVVELADQALYQAKKNGRNRVVAL